MATHYQTLGVSPTASLDEVRAAYRSAARNHHPDAGGDSQRMQDLNAAWRVLGDPVRRAEYDRLLANPPAAHGTADDDGLAGGMPGEWQQAAVDLDDLGDRPLRPIRGLEGWWAILPPGVLLSAIGLLVGAFVFAAPGLIGMALGAFVLAGGLFVLAPLRAMTRRSDD